MELFEHIRLRPCLYIMGEMGDGDSPGDGIYKMLKEIIDNSINEFVDRHGVRIILNGEEHIFNVSW